MKMILTITILLFLSVSAISQPDVAMTAPEPLSLKTMMSGGSAEVAWVAPAFPGGQTELMKFITHGLAYPELAWENSIEGTVLVRLTIAADGNVSNATILRSLGFGCDEAVLEQVLSLPPFRPGLVYGQVMESTMDIPVRFRLR